MKKCSYALAFEGGGVKGTYQIGAYKALIENNIKIDAIVGVSVGAINAALICSNGIEYVEELWKIIDSSIFDISPSLCDQVLNNKRWVKLKVINSIIKNKGISFNNLRNILNKYIDEDKVRNSKIKFGLVMTQLSGFKCCEVMIDDIPKGKLIDYLIASSSLPIFKIEKNIDNHYYLDGAFKNVLPLSFLEKLGYKNIIGIRLKKFGIIKRIKNKDTSVFLIKPSKNTGSVIFFNQDTVMRNISLGYEDTKKIIDKLR